MLKYMLDTDTVSFALRGLGNAATRLLEHPPSEVCISSITLAWRNTEEKEKPCQRS